MVSQDNNIDKIKIYVDLRKLNDACLHDPFPTPFTNEVLDNVEARRYILLQMDFQDTVRSGLPRKIAIRLPFPQNRDPTNIQ